MLRACVLILSIMLPSCGQQDGESFAVQDNSHDDPIPSYILIDTDTALSVPTGLDVDDDLAVLFALDSSEVHIVGLTVTYGNAPIPDTYRDALHLMGMAGRGDIPVCKGAGWLSRELNEPTEASRFLIDTLLSFPAKAITVVCLGPLSNLATALRQHPGIERRIQRLVLMGGNLRNGLVDLNFSAHPEATEHVLGTRIPKYVIPTETCIQTSFRREELQLVGEHPASVIYAFLPRLTLFVSVWGILGDLLYGSYPDRAPGGFFPWDVVAMAYVVAPHLFSQEQYMTMHMREATLFSEPTSDLLDHVHRVTVPCKIDTDAFRRLALSRICGVRRVGQ